LKQIIEAAKTCGDQPKLSHKALRSMDRVWAFFKEQTSWYNNSLVVEAVVRLCGSGRDKKNLTKFQGDRANLAHFLHENAKYGNVARKFLKRKRKFSDERLEQVRLTVCDLLETTTCSLDRQKSRVKLTMSIPMEVAECIFPLSPARKKDFHKALPTLISISCGKFTTNFKVLLYRYIL